MPFLIYFFLMFSSLYTGPLMANSTKTVFGYIEKATLVDQDLTISAKLDTVDKSSSLNSSDIK
jgi:hypothetical protein